MGQGSPLPVMCNICIMGFLPIITLKVFGTKIYIYLTFQLTHCLDDDCATNF